MKHAFFFSVLLLSCATSSSQFVLMGTDNTVVLPGNQIRIGSFFIHTEEPLYLDTCWMNVYALPDLRPSFRMFILWLMGSHMFRRLKY